MRVQNDPGSLHDESAASFAVVWLAVTIPVTLVLTEARLLPLLAAPVAIRFGYRWRAFRRLCSIGLPVREALDWADESGTSSPAARSRGWRIVERLRNRCLAGGGALGLAWALGTQLLPYQRHESLLNTLILALFGSAGLDGASFAASLAISARFGEPMLGSAGTRVAKWWRCLLRTALTADGIPPRPDQYLDEAHQEVERLLSSARRDAVHETRTSRAPGHTEHLASSLQLHSPVGT